MRQFENLLLVACVITFSWSFVVAFPNPDPDQDSATPDSSVLDSDAAPPDSDPFANITLPKLEWMPLKSTSNATQDGRSLTVINDLISKITGGGSALATLGMNLVSLAKYFGLTPTHYSFIIDNHAKCTIYVKCSSLFSSTDWIPVENPDGLIVRFYTSITRPKALTNWKCTFRKDVNSAAESYFNMFGNGAPKLQMTLYLTYGNGRVNRLDDLNRKVNGITGYHSQIGESSHYIGGISCDSIFQLLFG